MKKLLCAFAVLVFTAFSVNAQLYLGPKMGINIAKAPTTEKVLPKGNKTLFKSGLNIGAAANLGLGKILSLQVESTFSQKGYKDQWTEPSNKVEETITANYIELVAMPRITLGGEILKVYVNAGPSIGYMLSGKTTIVRGENIDEQKIDFNNLKNDKFDLTGLKRTEFGLNVGGGVLLAAGAGNIVLDFRYTYGLTPMRKWDDTADHTATWNNSVISLTAGYLFKLK